jgi:hypothetical protein
MSEKHIGMWSLDNGSDWSKQEATGGISVYFVGYNTDNAEYFYAAGLRMVVDASFTPCLQQQFVPCPRILAASPFQYLCRVSASNRL